MVLQSLNQNIILRQLVSYFMKVIYAMYDMRRMNKGLGIDLHEADLFYTLSHGWAVFNGNIDLSLMSRSAGFKHF